MTDEKPELMEGALPRSKPARPTRTRPAARHANGTVDELAEIKRELAEIKAQQQGAQFVATRPDPSPPVRDAEAEELTSFQRELRAQTNDVPDDYKRDPTSYNWPLKWFCKRDGNIVQLQGDPQNTEYYRNKGFWELTSAQVQRYLKVERLEIIRVQQDKANLVDNIRRVFSIEPHLAAGAPKFETDKDQMTVAELEQYWSEMTRTDDGQPRFRLQRPKRLQVADDKRAEAESRKLLAGVETQPSRVARQAFEREQEEARIARMGGRAGQVNSPLPPELLEYKGNRGTHDIEVTPSNANQFR